MWTSSTMYTFQRPGVAREALATRSLLHGVDTVVGGCVELVHVEGGTPGDVHAGVTHTARLTVEGALAVQRLRGRILAVDVFPVPRGPEKEVRVRHAVVPHRMAESRDNVALAADLGKALWAVAPVKRLVIGHRCEPTTWRRDRQRRGPRSRMAAVLAKENVPYDVLPLGLNIRRCRAQQPGPLRHTGESAESCCLPALTRLHRSSVAQNPATAHDSASKCNDSGLRLVGGVRERPNRHDWKSCDLQGSVGSNPTSSARCDNHNVAPVQRAVSASVRTTSE